ncbi:MAG: ThiF family adenylyltransferase, partial [Bacteroidaceae bacterium]|nr:ThiF family adenylyltransferase [Bacteroidaceae bacterium]
MGQWTERTELLLGTEALQRLESAHVLVVGVGGVGGYAAEMLARAGVGKLTLVDADTVALSNLNRQLPALRETLNKKKVEIMGGRLRAINPTIELETHAAFLTPETVPTLLHETTFDFV